MTESRVESGVNENCDDDDVNGIVASFCAFCDISLKESWIRCTGCQPRVNICAHCFSMGVEFGSHENNHPYTVIVSIRLWIYFNLFLFLFFD